MPGQMSSSFAAAAMGTPAWYCPETGVYSSRHNPVDLPSDPFLDLPTYVLARPHGGTTALVDAPSGLSISYPQLRRMVGSVAAGLRRMGISSKDVVLILLPNSVFFPVVFLGVLSAGAVATAMNPLSSPEEMKRQVRDSGAVLAFANPKNVGRLGKVGIRVVEVPEGAVSGLWEDSEFGRILSCDHQDGSPRPVIRQEDTAAVIYSSGTTGSSKGALITHGNFIAMVELFVRLFVSLETVAAWENVYLAALPMFHIFGLSLFSVGLLSLGSVVVVMPRFDVEDAVRAIDRYKVTHFHCVPPILVALTRVGSGAASALSSLKQVFCGAAPLSERKIEAFLGRFPHVDFLQGYGMTETTAVGAVGLNTEKMKKYTSVGLLAPNTQAKVVHWQSGLCMPFGDDGELWLRGPSVMKGYLNNDSATTLTIDGDGWLRTGDIAHFDEDGYLYIVDRLKDTIKYKGYQIAPADLEAVLVSHPDVLDVAVTSIPDEEAGEIPVAFVVRKPGSKLSSAQVINHLASQVAPYKKVRKVVFVETLPRSPAGKILRRLLRSHPDSKL
ncbi:hypothetical protein Taro_031037 [Colocasia esculenta]|uniref:4-coumarate--CoA ligase n=1 Tax=Colocasia esculenta TaxID=4460 RepID=A0A843VHW5_COLES|nr:hypothetical protein [Colocasia esculenta]